MAIQPSVSAYIDGDDGDGDGDGDEDGDAWRSDGDGDGDGDGDEDGNTNEVRRSGFFSRRLFTSMILALIGHGIS